ncbi:peptide/nickel transport system permease protein [Cryobacterium mesophilum]|uniref:ABC transporter permease subunit n=1 Tax=Terrimesophilobacter mesophilus TaxID=433647 RepID=A0A4R8VBY5_9MICO|nr:ABC transporter permease subunit [Terrimesophilobacter mesophilus]MBB5633820.1 peptide/nickel transport system permease protein [Terrimesophilobacter mesophilus]TFB80499.1 ABC transporter permease subunit [Terrimesophilobacter mesophilus]
MVTFIARRLVVSVLLLLGAAFIMYQLTALAGDPLEEFYQSRLPNKNQLIAARTEALQLNVPAPLRFFLWLGGAAKCIIPFANQCDLGLTAQGQKVTDLLPQALGSTIQLVTAATVLAIVIGITIGIVSALRQYTTFDFVMTFVSFLLYSLPSFWVGILLKEFVAIRFNDFLGDPQLGPVWIAVISIVVGLIWLGLIGGELRRRVTVFLVSALATAAVLIYFSLTDWFLHPNLGPVLMLILSAGVALVMTALMAGLKNRRAMLTAGIQVVLAMICYFALQPLLNISSIYTILILALVTIAVGLLTGFLVGGPDRGLNMRVGAFTAALSAGLILVDRFMQAWPSYLGESAINGRPIATVGSQTPNLPGDIWIHGVDSFTHLLLPTLTLMLIGFAGYTRFSRAGMLDVLNQDYIRTARAKGMPERVVIVRHAFRNSLIPIATIVASDFGALLGGAIITEQVFAFSGMGALFQRGISLPDPNPVMGYFVVIAVMVIVFNFIADMTYSALDPRVRTRG